jgi:hypothetical protein
LIAAIFLAALATGATPAADVTTTEPPKKPISNDTEFSLVFTKGNSDTGTFGFKNTLLCRWTKELFRLKLEALRSAMSSTGTSAPHGTATSTPGFPAVGSSSAASVT